MSIPWLVWGMKCKPHRWCNGTRARLDGGISSFRAPVGSNERLWNWYLVRTANTGWLGIRCVRMAQHVYLQTVVSVSLHYKHQTKHVGLVQTREHYHHIECNLLSPWNNWKIAHVALNNNHLFTRRKHWTVRSIIPDNRNTWIFRLVARL